MRSRSPCGVKKHCARRPPLLREPAPFQRTEPVNATLLDATHFPRPTAGERALEHFLASGFRRIEPAGSASGRDLSRNVGRGDPRAAVPDREPDGRRGAVPPARIHDPRLPRLSRLRQGRRGRRIRLSRPGLPGAGRGRRRARPDRPRELRPPGRRSRRRGDLFAGDGGRRRGGRQARRPGSATPACSTPCSPRSPCRTSGGGGSGAASPRGATLAAILDARVPGPARPGRRARGAGERRPRTARARWSRTCSRSPASTPVGGRIGERDRRPLPRTGGAPLAGRDRRREAARRSNPISPSPAIRTTRRRSCARSRRRPASTSARRSTPSSGATASSPRAASRSRRRASRPPSCATSTITPASCSRRTIRRGRTRGPRSPAAATTASRASSAPTATFPPSAPRSRSTGCPTGARR